MNFPAPTFQWKTPNPNPPLVFNTTQHLPKGTYPKAQDGKGSMVTNRPNMSGKGQVKLRFGPLPVP